MADFARRWADARRSLGVGGPKRDHGLCPWGSKLPLLFGAFAAAFFCASLVGAQPLSVTDLGANPPDTLVTTLLGSDIAVFNVTYLGKGSSSGTFTGGSGVVGFNDGIILSNGAAASVVGPNLRGDCSVTNFLPGDADLAGMQGIPVTETFDATVLEFDFVPVYTNLTFQYVFSSDEYNEYVKWGAGQGARAGVNDAFGFFVNGVNYALVPGTNTYVSIDTVNACFNSSYYIDNNGGPTTFCGATGHSAFLSTQMDGLTTMLTINAPVNAAVTNHIKLVICDVGDAAIDSNVFIRARSLSSMPTPTPTETPTVTPTPTITPTPTVTPVHEDIFYVSENAFRPSGGPVSIWVSYTTYPGSYSLKIYNSAGEQVKTLDPEQVITEPKYKSYSWDGNNESGQPCASGIYVLYLIEPLERKFKRVLLIR